MHYLLLSPSLHTHTHPSTHTHTCILLPTHPLIHSLAFSPDHEVEAPAGVGFSYSDNPSVDYKTDDNITALDNYKFLVNWFSNYSEYKDNDFYVTYVCNTVVFLLQEGVSNCLVARMQFFLLPCSGESYAGIYVPTLVNTIRIMNQQTTTNRINLKGFMVRSAVVTTPPL